MTNFGRILSIEDYHKTPELSKSGTDEILVTPYHYWHKYRNPKREPFELTPSMRIGTAFHYMIGEPDLVSAKLAGMPDGMIRRGKAWDDFKSENDGKIILSYSEMESAREMDRAMRAHPIFEVISKGSLAERSFYWRCPVTGADLKARPDLINTEERAIFDFKSTGDISDEGVTRTFHDFNYRVQAAMCLDGLNAATESSDWDVFYFVAIENKAPWSVRLFDITEKALTDGRRLYQSAAVKWVECEKAQAWPSFDPQIKTIDLPPWYKP